jgi:hypothetical protein
MATPVVQSNGTGLSDNLSSITITKPTGLAIGDLMLALVFISDTAGNSRTISDEAGWTTVDSRITTISAFKAFWKIADSGDVAASNFTFDLSGNADSCRGIIFRITGHSASAPIANSYFNTYIATTANPTWNPTFSPKSSDSLLVMSILCTSLTNTPQTIGGYTVSGSNPTWTEQYENTESTDYILGVATATGNSASDIISVSATMAFSCTGHTLGFLSIPSETPIAATPASIALRAQPSAPTVAAAVNITPVSIALRAQPSAAFPYIPRTSNWQNESKPSTNWENDI